MTTYAITGATGKFGQVALKTLASLVSTSNIIALARNTEKAEDLLPAGVTVRKGDYTDQTSLTASLTGVDKLLFISSQPGAEVSREQQHANVVVAAKDAGVKYIAYTSFPDAPHATTPLALDHAFTEKAISDAGIAHSFLRNNWYLENELGTIKGAVAGQPFVYSAADGKAGWALEAYYAEAAARVLVADNAKDIYEFSGSFATYADLASATKSASGKNFDVLAIDDPAYTAGLKDAGLDDDTAALVTMFQTLIRDGNLDVPSTDLVDVLGHPLPELRDQLKTII